MRTLASFSIVLAAGLPAAAQIPLGDIAIDLRPYATGLTSPVMGTHAGDGSGRLFIVDQAGFIRIIDANGNLLPTPFLDVRSALPTLSAQFDERGLLGIAFHPDYENNGRFFVRHSVPRPDEPGMPCTGTPRGCHAEVLMEFSVSSDPNVANPVGTELFRVNKPEFNHNAGHLAFGPEDGMLYFTLGDGGGANDDQHLNPSPHGPGGNGQNPLTYLGSMHRIDVDDVPPLASYGIPDDNPFVGNAGALPETWAFGFRNPYRFSFDDGPGGDNAIMLGDVGQGLREEIDIVVPGANYGWVIKEGTICFDPTNPNTPLPTCANSGPFGIAFTDPIAEYTHADGIAIVGGYVYRGHRFPKLVGKYVFGDFSRDFGPTGRVFYMDLADHVIREFILPAPLGKFVLGLAEDQEGEVYLLTSDRLAPNGNTGLVLHIATCVPDLTGSSDPNDPTYGEPDGVVDASDFFYFLDAFAAADFDTADLTTSSDPNDPFYGHPDGVLDASDFFYYLDSFAAGCP